MPAAAAERRFDIGDIHATPARLMVLSRRLLTPPGRCRRLFRIRRWIFRFFHGSARFFGFASGWPLLAGASCKMPLTIYGFGANTMISPAEAAGRHAALTPPRAAADDDFSRFRHAAAFSHFRLGWILGSQQYRRLPDG